MIIDANLETQPGWGTHLGGNIGGVAPEVFGIDQAFPAIGGRFYISGCTVKGEYADGEAYIARPLCPNSGSLTLRFSLMLDKNVAANAQALEFDVKVTDQNGFTYNFSFQWLNAAGGALQISGQTGDWVSTGYASPSLLVADVWHDLALQYQFDVATQKYSFLSISIDEDEWKISEGLQNLSATKMDPPWTPGALPQVQLDLNAKGLQFSHLVSNMQLEWA